MNLFNASSITLLRVEMHTKIDNGCFLLSLLTIMTYEY